MLGHRSFFYVREQQDLITRVDEQLHSWLAHKHWNTPVEGEAPETVADGVRAVVVRDRTADGALTRRHRFVQTAPTGRWITELTVHRGAHDDGWVWLDVDQPAHREAQPPRLGRDLVAVLSGRDGNRPLSSRPDIVSEAGIHEVIDALRDPARRGLLFVAGTSPDLPLVQWTEYVARVTERTVGLASTVVLDAEATRAFDAAVPDHVRVAPGTIRTFRLRVGLDNPDDGIRHRYLTTGSIVRSDSRAVAGILWRQARDVTVNARLPRSVVRIDARLRGELDARIVTPAQPIEPSIREAKGDTGLLGSVLQAVLGSPTATDTAIRSLGDLALAGLAGARVTDDLYSRLRSLEGEIAEARRERDELRDRFDDERQERALAEEERAGFAEQVRRLRIEMQKIGHADTAWGIESTPSDDPRSTPPEDFDALLDSFDRLDYVEFTGKRSPTHQLMDLDVIGTWARKTWEALLALDDFARLRACGGYQASVEMYLADPPNSTCRLWSVNRHAADESSDVQSNEKYRAPRMLAVPEAVSPTRTIFMGAHVKIARSGTTTPRMHYYDATHITGKIYVGYIGRHLPTKRTN